MKKTTVCGLMVAMLFACVIPWTQAASSTPRLTAYSVPGNPFRVAVEAPGRVWYTLPAQNAIGNLVVTSPGVYEDHTYPLPVTNSQPYDIAYGAGAVWVTEQAGNKIARFDPLTETWTEYPIPTPNSLPTGLVVLPGSPVQVWFCEQGGNKLGQLLVPETGMSTFAEFPLPWAGAMMESVDAVSSEAVWFTAPGRQLIARFQLSKWREPVPGDPDPGGAFGAAYTGAGSRPYAIRLGSANRPWFTEPGSNRLGQYNPGTTGLFEWYGVPTSSSELSGIDYAQGYVWFTEKNSGRVGRTIVVNYEAKVRELTLPTSGSAPTDIAVDAAGCAWIAASGTAQIAGWCAPYFSYTYLPLVRR